MVSGAVLSLKPPSWGSTCVFTRHSCQTISLLAPRFNIYVFQYLAVLK